MKMAAAVALARVAHLPVPATVTRAYGGKKMSFGRDYIIPTPFDPRLIYKVSKEVARAAISSGIADHDIDDWEEYRFELKSRISHTHF